MSNSQSNRPRRSFASGSANSTSPQHVDDGLRYDGEDVPVLIRLPDLSPQALLREPTATAAPQVAQKSPPAEEKAEAAPEPVATSKDEKTPVVAAIPAAVPSVAGSSEASQPAANTTEPTAAQAPVDPSPDDQTPAQPSNTTNAQVKQATAEGSPSRNRRRKRGGRKQGPQQANKVQPASQQESPRGARRKTAPAANVVAQDRNILAFDKSRLLIGAGLVVVAGLTYFALSGGGDDPAEPVGTWAGGETGSVVKTMDRESEPEVDLWPGDQDAQASHETSTQAQQSETGSPATTPATDPVWSTNPGQQTANSNDPVTMPAADYSYNAPPITAPTNGQNYTADSYAVPNNEGPTSGWPPETSTPAQATSATQPIQTWPDAAMAEPTTDAPSGAPSGYYQSQAAGYTPSPSTVDGDGAPPVRTGRLETGPYPVESISTATNPGSQLNGTIEIPRPRANNEYNGSNVY